MTYCGSDIRLASIEQKRNPYFNKLDCDINNITNDNKKKMMMRWQRLWVHRVITSRNSYASANSIYPSSMIEKDLWIQNIMDISAYIPTKYSTKNPPLIVHAPSKKNIKGTKYIENTINELKQKGYEFEYKRIEGLANTEARKIYKEDADIIIDQLLLGGFGSLSVEAMYYGKPVICYLLEDVMQEHYPDVPIISATIESLPEKLIWLLDNPEERERIGKEGRGYAEQHFDSEKLNAALFKLYSNL